MRLYLSYGVLTEASKLCCELIAAILGKGKENFEMTDSITVTSSVKCLPTNAIDILLLELQNHQVPSDQVFVHVLVLIFTNSGIIIISFSNIPDE